jgi:hypothetical protein
MSGDGASSVLVLIGLLAAGGCVAAERPRLAVIVGIVFCAPALLRLFVAAVAG